MKKPELTAVGSLGPRDEIDRASHSFGKCSECHEVICVEKAVTDGPNVQAQTRETLNEAFRTHVKLKHSDDFTLAAVPAHRTARRLAAAPSSEFGIHEPPLPMIAANVKHFKNQEEVSNLDQ
jgi:hypothetical protein